jgi:hypothetical protein
MSDSANRNHPGRTGRESRDIVGNGMLKRIRPESSTAIVRIDSEAKEK